MSSPPQGDWSHRIPARYATSLLSRTDSTVSHIPGPGRLLDSLLSRAGRRIEPILSRTAERMGAGPTVLLRRLLNLIIARHNGYCKIDLKTVIASVDGILDLAHYPCWLCTGSIDFSIGDDTRQACRGILVKLLQYLK